LLDETGPWSVDAVVFCMHTPALHMVTHTLVLLGSCPVT